MNARLQLFLWPRLAGLLITKKLTVDPGWHRFWNFPDFRMSGRDGKRPAGWQDHIAPQVVYVRPVALSPSVAFARCFLRMVARTKSLQVRPLQPKIRPLADWDDVVNLSRRLDYSGLEAQATERFLMEHDPP